MTICEVEDTAEKEVIYNVA